MKKKYSQYIKDSIDSIISEGRYRTFANIQEYVVIIQMQYFI